jgi:hypothetical protein
MPIGAANYRSHARLKRPVRWTRDHPEDKAAKTGRPRM